MTLQPNTPSGQPRPHKGQLFTVKQYLYVVEGKSFTIHVQESSKGIFTAHAQSTSDPHEAIHPMSGPHLQDVLQSLTHDIDRKVSKW